MKITAFNHRTTNQATMKTIICGSRTINDYREIDTAIQASGFHITTVISGGARGVDRMGEIWARTHNRLLKIYPANWRKYGNSAGYLRNDEMAEVADAVIALWDGVSKGTKHMIDTAERKGLAVYVHRVG